MAKTYTGYKLTDQQLIRLSQVVHGRPNKFGVSIHALERKGLIEKKPNFNELRCGKDCFYFATDDGKDALTMARAEGW